MDADLLNILAPCLEQHHSLTVCGGSPTSYARALEAMVALLPHEHGLALMTPDVGCNTGLSAFRVYEDAELSGSDFCRSALRQDPDTIVLDQRAESTDPAILLSAKQTGHRVILHRLGSAQQVHAQAVELLNESLPGYAGMLLEHEVFVNFDPTGQPTEVWQAAPEEGGGSRLVLIATKEESSWTASQPLSTRQAYQPPAVSEQPMTVPSDWATRSESLLEELRKTLGPQRRSAWGPIKDESTSAESSRFGGHPKLSPGEEWPCCGACQSRMPLVLEVELSTAPPTFQEQLGAEGLFQFFYCTASGCSVEEAWEPFQPNSLSRVLQGSVVEASGEEGPVLEPVSISGWQEILEAPDSEEREQLWPAGRELLGGWSEALIDTARYSEEFEGLQRLYSEVLEYFEITPEQLPELASYLGTARGDKLMGWPAWTQAPSYPVCPTCGESMTVLVQINNDGYGSGLAGHGSTYGQLFAADGNGHVFHCHGHLTFAWACG